MYLDVESKSRDLFSAPRDSDLVASLWTGLAQKTAAARRRAPMQYEREELRSILRTQMMHVEVVDHSGHVCFSAPGSDCLGRFLLNGYVGRR